MNIEQLTRKMVAPFLFEQQGDITVLLPGGYKPPHGGHLHIANQYAAHPEVSQVLVFVSPKEREGVTQKQSLMVLKTLKLNPKIKVMASAYESPVQTAYEHVLALPQDMVGKIALGASDKENDQKRSNEFVTTINGKYKTVGTRDGKHTPQGITAILLPVPQPIVYGRRTDGLSGQPISATILRKDIVNKDYKHFATNYPNVDPTTVKKLFDMLTKNLRESLDLKYNDESVSVDELGNKLNPSEEPLKEERRGGLMHFEDLSPAELLNFLKAWNENNQGFEVTEKVDGKDMEFGVDEEGFYTSSRNTKARQSTDYAENFMFDDFRLFHERLQNINILGAVGNAVGHKVNTVSVKGEGIASYDSNVTLYSQEKIGKGVFIIIHVIADGKGLDRAQVEKFAANLSSQGETKFTATPKVGVGAVKFKHVEKLAKIIQKYDTIINSRTTPKTKELKTKILNVVKTIAMSNKDEMLKALQTYKSHFGDEIEGVVFKAPDGSMVKVIDKSQFLKRKNLNWHYMEQISMLDRSISKQIKQNPSQIRDLLIQLSDGLQKIKIDFDQNADKYIQIPKKKEDTIKYFQLVSTKLGKALELLKNESPESVADKYIKKQIAERKNMKLKNLMEQIQKKRLTEGGTSFGPLPNMPVQYRDATIQNCIDSIKMHGLQYRHIGNYLKPEMNDVDIAVDINAMAKYIGLKEPFDKDTFFDALRKYMNKLGLKEYKRRTPTESSDPSIVWVINTGLIQISFKAPVVDDHNKFMGESIQIDFMIGNVPWMEKVMSGAQGTRAGLKAAHRNYLLTSAFAVINMNTKDPAIKQKYQLDFKNGLQLVTYTMDAKGKRVKLDVKTIETDPEKMLRYLFKDPISYADVSTFETMFTKMMSPQFKFPKLRDAIFKEYVKTVKTTPFAIPQELAQYDTN